MKVGQNNACAAQGLRAKKEALKKKRKRKERKKKNTTTRRAEGESFAGKAGELTQLSKKGKCMREGCISPFLKSLSLLDSAAEEEEGRRSET